MLGRLNAAQNQTANWNRTVEDVYEHFSYVPRQATANAQDIPFFLSTRLLNEETMEPLPISPDDPAQHLAEFEKNAAALAAYYEEHMVRF